MILTPHNLALAVLEPQIAPNTGNIARLCVATATPLHLTRPLGFHLTDPKLKRSAMDYWPRLNLTIHDSTAAFFNQLTSNFWLTDSTGQLSLFDTPFQDGDTLILGNEPLGIPPQILAAHPHRVIRIPQAPGERCLNLATAAGILLYTALHRINPRT